MKFSDPKVSLVIYSTLACTAEVAMHTQLVLTPFSIFLSRRMHLRAHSCSFLNSSPVHFFTKTRHCAKLSRLILNTRTLSKVKSGGYHIFANRLHVQDICYESSAPAATLRLIGKYLVSETSRHSQHMSDKDRHDHRSPSRTSYGRDRASSTSES